MKVPIQTYITLNIVFNQVVRLDKDGKWKGAHFNVKYGNVTGCNSGKVYKVIDTGNKTYSKNDNNYQIVTNTEEKFHLIGKKGEKYTITWRGHVTTNANGDTKVDYWEQVACE